MPKIVDHAKQREKIIEATWRVILRDGIGQTPVRKVAEEAGLSPGAMRHYFSSQSDLLAFSLEFIGERITKRFQHISQDQPPLVYMQKAIEELLPLDQERMQETEIWFSFASQHTSSDPRQQELNRKIYNELRSIFADIIDGLIQFGMVPAHLQRDVEIDRLYALVDGLAVHKLLQPDQMPVEQMRTIITNHLASLCKD